MTLVENMAERTNDAIRQHADLIRAHDTVHPNRSDCGGVGRCLMMRSEVDSERDIIDQIDYAVRKGYDLGVSLVKSGSRA